MTHSRRTIQVRNNIRELLQKNDMKPRQLFEKLDGKVKMATVYRWIEQQRQPDRSIVPELCLILKCDKKNLFDFL